MSRKTFNDQIEDFFKARPLQWIEARELQAIGGQQAWRTRVSEVRHVRGLRIENRVEQVRDRNGATWKRSLYRYVPAAVEQPGYLAFE